MNWHMIGACAAIFSIIGALILAAAKSIFITKTDFDRVVEKIEAGLYDEKKLPVFVPRRELDDLERRRDNSSRVLWNKINELASTISVQNKTDAEVNGLLDRLDRHLKNKG